MPQTYQTFLCTPFVVKVTHTSLDLTFAYFEFRNYSELWVNNRLVNTSQFHWLNFTNKYF